jgi:hypothetical protein
VWVAVGCQIRDFRVEVVCWAVVAVWVACRGSTNYQRWWLVGEPAMRKITDGAAIETWDMWRSIEFLIAILMADRGSHFLGSSLGGGEVHHQDPLYLERGLVPW